MTAGSGAAGAASGAPGKRGLLATAERAYSKIARR